MTRTKALRVRWEEAERIARLREQLERKQASWGPARAAARSRRPWLEQRSRRFPEIRNENSGVYGRIDNGWRNR